jgi:hypothetical protein
MRTVNLEEIKSSLKRFQCGACKCGNHTLQLLLIGCSRHRPSCGEWLR